MRLRAGGSTPIERLRGERMCADSGRYMQTTFRKCADNGKEGSREGKAENVRLRVDRG